MDEGIKTLTDLLNNDIGKYFRVKPSIGNVTKKAPANSKTAYSLYLSVDDKPWFDEKLKLLYKDYIIALRNFNHFKNCHSHSELNIKKRLYKKYEARAKRLYMKSEGDRLELLKKNNPKQFFAKFKKRRGISTKVSLREFYDYFKNVSNAQEDNVIENDSTEGNCIFEELDREISIDEI